MSEWKQCRLGDVADYVVDKIDIQSLDTKHYVSTDNMLPNKGGIEHASKLPDGSKTPCFHVNDILVSNIRPYFKKIWKATHLGGASPDVLIFRGDPQKITQDYLYYILSDDSFFNYSVATSKGTKMPRGDKKAIMDYTILLPSLPTQRKIASILSALDDKIELNNRMNKNLEEQARAIFKSWFVDFEPWGGVMPGDWITTTIGKVCKCQLGGTPSRNVPEYWNGNIPWINSGEVNKFRIIQPTEYITNLGVKESSTKLLPSKTTVIAITGATLGKVSLLEISSCANQSVVGIIPNQRVPFTYIYPFIKHAISDITTHQTGGAQQHINKQNIESTKVIIPNDMTIMNQFNNNVNTIYNTISSLCFESRHLAALRDTLLPKLMSGELDVSDINL